MQFSCCVELICLDSSFPLIGQLRDIVSILSAMPFLGPISRSQDVDKVGFGADGLI